MDGTGKSIFLLACLWLACEVRSYKPCVPYPCRYAWQERGFVEEIDSSEHGQHRGEKGTTCRCGWTNKDSGRIVGGRETLANEFPYMAALLKMNGDKTFGAVCGGAIVTQYHVITAAHCMKEKIVAVAVGEHNIKSNFDSNETEVYALSKIIAHEGYDRQTNEKDIAVLVTEKKIKFSVKVGPVCLPNKAIPLRHEYVKVTGWGYTKHGGEMSDVLLKVNLRVIPLEDCAHRFWNEPISSAQFCTYGSGKDACQGDSGGPVVWLDPETNRFTLVGVVSYGWLCATLSPAVSTDVYTYNDWIMKAINDTKPPAQKVTHCTKKD